MASTAGTVRIVAAILFAASNVSRADATDIDLTRGVLRAYQQDDTGFRRELEHLSHVAFAQGWAQLGETARDWRSATPASGSLVFVAPSEYSSGVEANSSSADETSGDAQAWLDEFSDLRRRHADALYQLAKDAAEAGQLSLALQWATEAVRENPDHADARRVLGYEQRGGKWLTSYGARMADAGKIWHPRFGWVVEADVARYESGERLLGTRWISAEADAARHKDIKSGWQVRTDHFLVKTDYSLEAAAELAARLERLHQVWRQLFAGFYLSEREVRGLFAGERQPRKQARPFRVYYHKDRDQYAAALRRRQPRIAETLGIYFDTNREAHFFADSDQNVATLYHEAVHQLFQETKPAARRIGEDANFWVVEGVAAYFETLTEHAGGPAGLYYTAGESAAGRLPSARELLAGGYYVPLAELTQMGKEGVQGHPEIAKLYAQSAGLAAFFMSGEEGRYREALVSYLDAVYSGRDDQQTLAEVTQSSNEELDAQYRRFMESLP